MKRKFNENEETEDDSSPSKKLKLDDSKQNEIKEHYTDAVDDNSFDIQLGNNKTAINLFAMHTINNNNAKHIGNKTDTLNSLKIGQTDWKLEFYQMPTDPKHHIYQFLDGLFGDKLCDWKEYMIKDNENENENDNSNNFISIIKDDLGVWRGAILFIIYELKFKQNENNLKYLIKIPLAGVDLHFRRQNVGTILVNYTVSIIHKIMQYKHDKYEIIVLVMDDIQAKSFWKKNNFIPAIDYKHKQLNYKNIFDRDLMIKKGFVQQIENELIIMMYIGNKTTDLLLKNEIINKFETPKYVNFNQRYCKKHEIEETEKNIKKWEQKKKELEEKNKNKNANHEKDDESDDEDFDFEKAKQCQSSNDDDNEDEAY